MTLIEYLHKLKLLFYFMKGDISVLDDFIEFDSSTQFKKGWVTGRIIKGYKCNQCQLGKISILPRSNGDKQVLLEMDTNILLNDPNHIFGKPLVPGSQGLYLYYANLFDKGYIGVSWRPGKKDISIQFIANANEDVLLAIQGPESSANQINRIDYLFD